MRISDWSLYVCSSDLSVTAANLRPILVSQIDPATMLFTDDAGQYRHMGRAFKHEAVNHSAGEYVRGVAHTNTVDRKSVVSGRSVSVRVDVGGCRLFKKQNKNYKSIITE